MDVEVEKIRPNIRIEIHNNVNNDSEEKMDIESQESENEEGEICDDTENKLDLGNVDILLPKKFSTVGTGVFATGINIFDKKEQEKLHERAKRFALKPEEIHSFTDQDLEDLYESLGINPSNEADVKYDSVHMLGINEMTTEDVLDYFAHYAPDGVEWIDDGSCNVVWLDNISAARALHFKSKVVRGMPAREPREIYPKEFLDDIEDVDKEPGEESGQSILLKNKNREIELQDDGGDIVLLQKKSYPKNSADISEINVPIPPGYWRLGHSHPKSKCLLLRYGLISDKKPYKSEKLNKYYKKIANPTQKNVISESKKKELRSIFERNRELSQDKNPWGSLAKNWDRDAKFREREPIMYNMDLQPEVEIKNTKLLARLGTKRKMVEEENEEKMDQPEPEKDEISRNWATEKKKTKMIGKIPRMKMYADEEEENLKRKKLLQTIKKQAEKIDKTNEVDLRSMLGPTHKLLLKKDISEQEQSIDLGTKLKNRSQKMVFAIERDLFDMEPSNRQDYPDMRTQILERTRSRRQAEVERDRSPHISRSLGRSRHDIRERRNSPPRRRRSTERSHRLNRRKTPERTLHSDHMYSSRATRNRTRSRRSYSSDEEKYSQKPRSKVAVVIKTPKIPTVASTVWSRVKKSSEESSSDSDSESEESEKSSSSSESESDSGEQSDSSSSSNKRSRNVGRPGFENIKSRLSQKFDHKSPLKITMANDRYKK